jgi:hypothetical protein
MAFVPVPDTILVEMRMLLDSQRVENTLYFRKTGGWIIADVTPLVNALIIWWQASLGAVLSTGLTLREIAVTDLSSLTGFSVSQTPPTPLPTGSDGGEHEPNNVALCVSFRTLSRGRSFRGRNYVTGLPESRVSGSFVSDATVAAIQAAYQLLPGIAVTAGCIWVVVSRFTAGAPRVTGITTEIDSVVVIDNVVDSQRRRLPGRGS